MSKLNLKLSSLVSSLCAVILGFLGFGCSSESDDPEDPSISYMYGTPTGYFEIKGEVTDEEGKPISDVDVRVTSTSKQSTSWYLDNDTTSTTGKFTLQGTCFPSTELKVVCVHLENSFEADSTSVYMNYVKDSSINSMWYQGSAKAEVNFKLKRKSEE